MRIFAIIIATLCCAGCASVTRGTTDQVQFVSDPPGADAHDSMGHACITPCSLQFNRKDEFTVVFTKRGYGSQQIGVTTRIAGAGAAGFAGNIILGGGVGMVVDAASGATLEHCPNPVMVHMQPLAVPPPRRGTLQRAPPPPDAEPPVTVIAPPPECVPNNMAPTNGAPVQPRT